MSKFDFQQPDFLFCEIPIKNGSQNDNRIWVYHRVSLSLIEFIEVTNFKDFQFKGKQARFEFECFDGAIKDYFGVFVQNNCEATSNNADEVIANAWNFLQKYLRWKEQ